MKESQRRTFNKIEDFFPDTGPLRRELYKKHVEFFAAGEKFRERVFLSANRVGKTESGAYEICCHLTGNYPHWWVGKRFKRPVNALVAGETGRLVRDTLQKKLLGEPNNVGSGMVPKSKIKGTTPKQGIPDAIDTVYVKHVSGRDSILQFQSFDQGREAFQGTERDIIWLDEEAPLSIYSECLIRTMTTQGIVLITFTPLKGVTDTVISLQEKAKDGRAFLVQATWDDCGHLSEKDKEELLASLPPHQREARSKGIPQLGSGAVYPIVETDIVCEPFKIPAFWRQAYGLDVGWNWTAAMWMAHDPDNDVIYLTGEYKRGHAEPAVHAAAIKARGEWIPGVVDPASQGRSQKDGEKLIDIYRASGLDLSPADNSVEAGIFDIYKRMTEGRFKVFRTCTEWLSEYRLYRRDEKGKIVKENDHCFHGDTEVLTKDGIYKIKDLVGSSGQIMSLNGEFREFHSCRKTRENSELVEVIFEDGYRVKCTPDHKFYTTNGFINAVDLKNQYCYDGVSESIRIRKCAQSSSAQNIKYSTEKDTHCLANIMEEAMRGFTELYGLTITALSQKATTFITLMKTATITTQKTWSLSMAPNISAITSRGNKSRCLQKLFLKQQNGIIAKRVVCGIKSITKSMPINFTKRFLDHAHIVGAITKLKENLEKRLSAPINAKAHIEERPELMMSKERAQNAGNISLQTNIPRKKPVEDHALVKCVGVSKINDMADVYCLTVPYNNLFCLANGAVVHNCQDAGRYVCRTGVGIAEYNAIKARESIEIGNRGGTHISSYSPLDPSYVTGEIIKTRH